MVCSLLALTSSCRKFTKEGIRELERFNSQKNADFRSILINYVQLQMHIHKKVVGNNWVWREGATRKSRCTVAMLGRTESKGKGRKIHFKILTIQNLTILTGIWIPLGYSILKRICKSHFYNTSMLIVVSIVIVRVVIMFQVASHMVYLGIIT